MKLGELFFEQIFIGALVLLVLIVPFAPDLMCRFEVGELNTFSSIAGGALILGVAFVLGMVFDRVADSLSGRLDAHHRLRYALRTNPQGWPDPYPEDAYHFATLKLGKEVVTSMNYHRSRIRIARAFMVYGPALTVSIVVATARFTDSAAIASNPFWLLLVAVTYVATGFANQRCKPLPKTFEIKELKRYADEHHKFISSKRVVDADKPSVARILIREPLVFSGALLLIVAVVLAAAAGHPAALLSSAAAISLVLLSAWTWWRITTTYRQFLALVGRSAQG